MFLCTWSKSSWSDAVPKDKAFTSPQVKPQQMSEGQMETVPLFLQPLLLQLYPQRIPGSRQAKIRGTNYSAKELSGKHSHSQTVFSGPGKFQE